MRVFVECYPDWALARSLGISSTQLGHAFTKAKVLQQLAKFDGDAVGLIDADTGKLLSNPREMANYRERERRFGVILMSHSSVTRKSLVLIDPRLEEWLCKRADASSLILSKYGLPRSAALLHRISRPDRNPQFNRFLIDLAEADHGMKLLGKWLNG